MLLLLPAIAACSRPGQVKEEPPQSVTLPSSSPSTRTAPPSKVAARKCPSAPAANGNLPPSVDAKYVTATCKVDGDCKDGREGRCVYSGGGHAASILTCTYDACESDADCSGTLCICGAGGTARNACIPGNCHDDSDCSGGARCETSVYGVRGTYGRFCHGTADRCSNASDCQGNETCNYVGAASRWECMPMAPRPVG